MALEALVEVEEKVVIVVVAVVAFAVDPPLPVIVVPAFVVVGLIAE